MKDLPPIGALDSNNPLFKMPTQAQKETKMTIGREQPGGPEQARSFEASLEALEQIVQQLESGDLPLEKSLELFEQGVRLSRECQERLSQAERRIEVLLRDNQGRTVVTNFNEANQTTDDGVAENENGF